MSKASAVSVDMLQKIAARQVRSHVPQFCGVEGCGRPHRALNLCVAHYLRLHKHRKKIGLKFEYPFDDVVSVVQEPSFRKSLSDCQVAHCHGKYVSRGLCRKHYQHWWRLNRG
jgi:hypothetical protein